MRQKRFGSGILEAIRKTNIKRRLLLILLSVSMIPTVLVGFFSQNIYTASINKKLSDSAGQAVQLLDITLETELERYTFYINSLSVSGTVQEALSRTGINQTSLTGSESVAIKRIIETTTIQVRHLKGIRIVDRDGRVVYDQGYEGIPDDRFREILARLDVSTPSDSLVPVRTFRASDTLALGRKIYRFGTARPIGYIVVFVHEKLLHDAIYKDLSYGPDSNILLLTGQGEVLSSKAPGLTGASLTDSALYQSLVETAQAGENAFTFESDGKTSLIIFSHSARYNTYFLASIPHSYIVNETRQITLRLTLMMLLVMLVSIGASFLLYFSIMQPIRRIVERCEVAADESLDKVIGDTSPDELGFLARTIDRIIEELKSLGHRWQNDQLRKRELELEMLQYQINPHFLFNTLNTLKWVAVMNEVPVLDEGISSLAALLQSTLMDKDELITIAEEIKNLRHYFSIQRIRYADCFDVAYELDESLEQYLIPRFIIQPLAENSVLHGTEEGSRTVCITVRCAREASGDVALEIIDNGSGFDISRIKTKHRDRFSGIGLANVDERLKLYFGADYGLAIESQISVGTRCRIIIPKRWLDKEGSGRVSDSAGGR